LQNEFITGGTVQRVAVTQTTNVGIPRSPHILYLKNSKPPMCEYKRELKRAIAENHASDAMWTGTHHVAQVCSGETTWEGNVEAFHLFMHPKAKTCFAWGTRRWDDSGWDVTIVLGIPPVYSAHDAVQAVIGAPASLSD
jgi:hypothetical protein